MKLESSIEPFHQGSIHGIRRNHSTSFIPRPCGIPSGNYNGLGKNVIGFTRRTIDSSLDSISNESKVLCLGTICTVKIRYEKQIGDPSPRRSYKAITESRENGSFFPIGAFVIESPGKKPGLNVTPRFD
jgi:hypothetical protein